MTSSDLPGAALPNYRTPRLLGILNIVFASLIMVYGLCIGASFLLMPTMSRAMGQVQQSVEAKAEAQRKAALAALDEKAKAAKTDQEKAEIEALRKDLEARPRPVVPMIDFSRMFSESPVVLAWYWVEILSGLTVNVMMLVAGIGLLRYREGGRRLGVWTAALKIARLVTVYSVFILAVVPPLAQGLGKMVGEMIAQQQAATRPGAAPPPVDMMVRMYVYTYSSIGVGMIVFGSIYPAVSLWLLTRPATRAACAAKPGVPRELGETW
jgi:hypothetical protein